MNEQESLKAELETRLEEYRQLKSEIVSNLESGRQVTNLTLTFAGVMIALIPFIVQQRAEVLFLIAPLFFYFLAWTQLRYVYLVLDMGKYLATIVVPRIQAILRQLAESKQDEPYRSIMSWETKGKAPLRLRGGKVRTASFLPIAGANFGLPLFAAFLSVTIFFIVRYPNWLGLVWYEWFLLILDVLGFIYSAYWGIQAELKR